MYDLAIFYGHGQGDPGAIGNNYREYDLVFDFVKSLVRKLEDKLNIDTNLNSGLNNYNNNLTKDKKYKYNFALSFHCNSANDSLANGFEFFVPCKEKYIDLENLFSKTLEKYKFKNRGVKAKDYNTNEIYYKKDLIYINAIDYYREIREAWNNKVSLTIVELFFISNKDDLNIYLSNKDKIILDIANNILEYCNKDLITSDPKDPEENKYYRIVCGSYKNKNNAENRKQELKTKYGIDSFIDFR